MIFGTFSFFLTLPSCLRGYISIGRWGVSNYILLGGEGALGRCLSFTDVVLPRNDGLWLLVPVKILDDCPLRSGFGDGGGG